MTSFGTGEEETGEITIYQTAAKRFSLQHQVSLGECHAPVGRFDIPSETGHKKGTCTSIHDEDILSSTEIMTPTDRHCNELARESEWECMSSKPG